MSDYREQDSFLGPLVYILFLYIANLILNQLNKIDTTIFSFIKEEFEADK